MTQEDKELLLKDLCARLSCKVKLGFENSDLILIPEEFNVYTMQLSTNQIYPKVDRAVIKHIYDIWNYRPYLRPMSSMTEEECIALSRLRPHETDAWKYIKTPIPLYIANIKQFDFFHRHHLDWRGLILMGLALEAPEGMYKTE